MRKIVIKLRMLVTINILLLNFAAVSAYGQEAKQLYEQTCSMCHGTNGKGDGPNAQVLQPKPADLTIALKGKKDTYLAKLIKEGGGSVGKSPLMPSYKGLLSDEQVQSLIKHVKGFIAQ